MGGVFGHMSHIYDNPNMTFGQIKDIMKKASTGKLENVTEKTDGQNLFVSYKIDDGTQRWVSEEAVRSARNKGDIKNGGMTPEQLATKFAGRGALEAAFTNAFRAFAKTVDKFSDEEKLLLFGPDTNIYYNAEVMDPANANVINYDTKTFLIHRAGHAEYDKETGKPIHGEEGFSEQQAQKLQDTLEVSQEELGDDEFKVQVNAIRQLESLTDKVALKTAEAGINKAIAMAGMRDEDTIADYIFAQWKKLVESALPELTDEQEKLIIDRVMTDYYGALEGEGPLKSRGLETRQITKAIGRPELNEAIISLIKDYPRHFKEFIFPIESVIHRFAIEILRAFKSAYIIAAGGNEKEVARLQALVGKAIETIKSSGNEEAMEIIKNQVDKLSQLEDDGSIGNLDLSMISSAAEGIVFDYDGHTYKFTGGFAPANQILGLFKYGRKGIPAFADDLAEGVSAAAWAADLIYTETLLSEGAQTEPAVVYIPGGFKPPHKGHLSMVRQAASKWPRAAIRVVSGRAGKGPTPKGDVPTGRDGVTLEMAADVWSEYFKRDPLLKNSDVGVSAITAPLVARDFEGQPRRRKDGEIITTYSPIEKIAQDVYRSEETPTIAVVYSKKDEGYGRMVREVLKELDQEGKLLTLAADVERGAEDVNLSSTNLRRAIRENDFETFKLFLPEFYNEDPEGALKVFSMLGGNPELDEMAGMASGAVVGASGKQYRDEDEKNEGLVNEVMNYLLGITVG